MKNHFLIRKSTNGTHFGAKIDPEFKNGTKMAYFGAYFLIEVITSHYIRRPLQYI